MVARETHTDLVARLRSTERTNNLIALCFALMAGGAILLITSMDTETLQRTNDVLFGLGIRIKLMDALAIIGLFNLAGLLLPATAGTYFVLTQTLNYENDSRTRDELGGVVLILGSFLCIYPLYFVVGSIAWAVRQVIKTETD